MAFLSVDSMRYLVEIYWPYLVGAGLIGFLSGWFFAAPPRRSGR
jgi:hypothetical protein